MSAAFDLDECRALLDLPLERVLKTLGLRASDGNEDVAYEGLEGVTHYYNPDRFPGRVYVRDGRVVMIYVPGAALSDVDPSELARAAHGEPEELRSRAGKEYAHEVYAEDGLAFSSDGESLAFLEVFPPQSSAEYRANIYRDPGPFTR